MQGVWSAFVEAKKAPNMRTTMLKEYIHLDLFLLICQNGPPITIFFSLNRRLFFTLQHYRQKAYKNAKKKNIHKIYVYNNSLLLSYFVRCYVTLQIPSLHYFIIT